MARCQELDQSGTLLFSYREESDGVSLVCTCACDRCRGLLKEALYVPAVRVPKGRYGTVEVLDPKAEKYLARVSENTAWAMVVQTVQTGGAEVKLPAENQPILKMKNELS